MCHLWRHSDVITTSFILLTSSETLVSSTSTALSTMLLISLMPTFWNKINYRGSRISHQKIIEQKIYSYLRFLCTQIKFNFFRATLNDAKSREYHHVTFASRDMLFTWSSDKEAKNRFKNRELTPNLDPVWYAWMHFLELFFSALPIMDYETVNIKIKMVGGYFIPILLLKSGRNERIWTHKYISVSFR